MDEALLGVNATLDAPVFPHKMDERLQVIQQTQRDLTLYRNLKRLVQPRLFDRGTCC